MIILYIFFGSLIIIGLYYLIINNNKTNFTPTTTQQPITTSLYNAQILFQAGASVLSNFPGGAGGILIHNQGPTAGTGAGYLNVTKGGSGGKGYGSGGGASWCCDTCSIPTGNGSQGFVYLVEDKMLFDKDTKYTIQSDNSSYTFILMGGGACGGFCDNFTIPDNNTFVGGDCGQIVIKKIDQNLKNTQISVTIGKGGYIQKYFSTYKSYKGGDTSISFILNNNIINYTAYGAEPPNNNINGGSVKSKYTPLANGGYSSGNNSDLYKGGMIPQTVINNMNSTNPIPTN